MWMSEAKVSINIYVSLFTKGVFKREKKRIFHIQFIQISHCIDGITNLIDSNLSFYGGL